MIPVGIIPGHKQIKEKTALGAMRWKSKPGMMEAIHLGTETDAPLLEHVSPFVYFLVIADKLISEVDKLFAFFFVCRASEEWVKHFGRAGPRSWEWWMQWDCDYF